ncbi:ribosome hibernation-promoting factor, HPF/YfiA family [Desulfitibacter alkalitolerans]|uniref:ribosome hibernation-promoting factor, HPF/YfiA family n=1 Tax=Desulfitibacter alkalitolerans TaxID=264641 RepID=UPI00048091A0|nr:ribosome-associated translation inhibitor RaiA [Desulfitibacter alkalitolerans]
MNINVRGKNVQVTPALKDHVDRRIGKLGRFFDTDQEAQVTLTVEKDRHKVEVTMPLNGYLLRGEEETGDMYASIDMVIDKLEKQVEKYKTRVSRKIRDASIREMPPLSEIAEEEEPQLVRTKRFALKPMPVEEAIMQMNLIGHSFFVFSNADTEEVNVVYKRKDGNYGLIEPEF